MRTRAILGQAAQTARQFDPKSKTFYEGIAKKKGHNKALVATKRKMPVVLLTVLTRNEPYSGPDTEVMEKKYKNMMWLSSQ